MFFFSSFFKGLICECNQKSITKIEYDTNLRQPICSALNCTNAIECNIHSSLLRLSQPCGLKHFVEVISTSPPTKSIQIQRLPAKNVDKNQITNFTCPPYGNNLPSLECIDSKNYVRYKNYCIPNYLIKDFLNYKQFKVTTNQPSMDATMANDLFKNLDFIVFLCQTMKMTGYCEHVANLCVLTLYNLEKFSPCNIFYTMQTTLISAGMDSYQTKLAPFLFYAKGRSISDDLDKVIDYRYKYVNNDDIDYDSNYYDGFTPFSVSLNV